MTRFERWFLKRIIAKEVTQGFNHSERISNLYGMIREACEKEFYEDNRATMDDQLREWFERTPIPHHLR